MTIDEAIKQLEDIKKTHGNIKLLSYVQTGPDSHKWQNVTQIVPAMRMRKVVVEVFTE